jgi:activator of Hsp90 ATPase-like protein
MDGPTHSLVAGVEKEQLLGCNYSRLFSFTWHPYAVDPDVDYSQEAPTLVEFRLKPTSNGTLLIIVESGFDALPSNRKPDALRMNEGGWTEQIKNIQAHVEP